MKLLQTLTGNPFGGVQELFVKCAESFEESGIIQRVFVRDHASFTTRLRAANVETITLPLGRWFDFKSIPYIAKEIDRFRPDIILSWKTRAAVMNGHASRFAQHYAVRVGRLDGYYNVRRQINNSDHLIAVTPDILQFAVDNGWPSERVSFIPNFPVNEPGNEIPIRYALDIPAHVPLLLAAGRLTPTKGFDILLRAMESLEGVFLLLAGEGDERCRLVKLAQDIGIDSRVRFLGWREDISDLIASSDLVVCPSRHEPFGIVIVESWASRTPIIASAAAKGPAWLIRDGLDGLLTPTNDAEALAKSISLLIGNPELRRKLATSGHQRFETEFSKSAIIQRYLDVFRYLMKPRSNSC